MLTAVKVGAATLILLGLAACSAAPEEPLPNTPEPTGSSISPSAAPSEASSELLEEADRLDAQARAERFVVAIRSYSYLDDSYLDHVGRANDFALAEFQPVVRNQFAQVSKQEWSDVLATQREVEAVLSSAKVDTAFEQSQKTRTFVITVRMRARQGGDGWNNAPRAARDFVTMKRGPGAFWYVAEYIPNV